MKMHHAVRLLAAGALTALLPACELGGPMETEPQPVPALQTLTIATRSLPADGRAVTVVRAVIPASSRVLPRQVTFSTTVGAFAPGRTDSTTVTVAVDAAGEAVALLRAPAVPGLAVVRAHAGSTTLQDTMRFEPAPADLVSLTLSADSVAADSVSLVMVRAVIPRGSTVTPRSVVFEATAGLFPGDSVRVTVPVDSTGTATVLLRAPTAPGFALLRARAGNTVLQDSVRFYRAPPDLLSLTFSADSLQADGSSTVVVRAAVRTGTARTPRAITFETTSGAFGAGATPLTVTVPVDSAGVATALLRAPGEPGLALVRARAGNTGLESSIRFVRAYPESLTLSANSFRVGASAGNSLTITAPLRRSVGRVSPGVTVVFTATAPDGTAVGWFAGQTVSDTSGAVVATYTPGSTPYRGPVRIMAHTQGVGGSMIGGEMLIEVVDP